MSTKKILKRLADFAMGFFHDKKESITHGFGHLLKCFSITDIEGAEFCSK